MAATRPVWMERPTVPTSVIKVIVLLVIAVVMLYPFVYVVSVSLSSPDAVRAGDVLLFPIDPTLEAYRIILSNGLVARALMVSIGVTLVGTLISVVLTVTLAYGLTRTRDVPGARVLLYLVLFTMLFSAGIIPNYLLVKSLGLLDTYAALIVPVAINAFNLVVIRNFFMNLPQELIDSAKVDGASEFQILWRIVLPLSKAAVAVIALFYGVAYWNDFFHAMIYLNDTEKWPVQLVLRQYVLGGSPFGDQAGNEQIQLVAKNLQMAVVALATIPILAVYPFLQRFFTTGVLTGAIKG